MNELSLYILDICENSLHANSKNLYLTINQSKKDNLLSISIIDDGKGMDESTLKKVVDPFYTSRKTRKVGLGIPLFKELCELCEGSFQIESTLNVGTRILATFKLDSIDLPPLGNIVETLYILVSNEFNVDVTYKHIVDDKEFDFNTKELKEILDGVGFDEPSIAVWFKEFIASNLQEIK